MRRELEILESLPLGRTRLFRAKVTESSENAFHIYAALTIHGVPGLCFLRGNPQRLIQEYSLRPEQILLLSSRALFGFEAAEDLQEISLRVSRFLEKNRN